MFVFVEDGWVAQSWLLVWFAASTCGTEYVERANRKREIYCVLIRISTLAIDLIVSRFTGFDNYLGWSSLLSTFRQESKIMMDDKSTASFDKGYAKTLEKVNQR